MAFFMFACFGPQDVNLHYIKKRMNKNAVLALVLAISLPLAGYLLVKYFSTDAVHMPARYFYDSVAVNVKNGKTTTDTAWHRVRDIKFTNQLGKAVSLNDLKGKVLVVDFFYTLSVNMPGSRP